MLKRGRRAVDAGLIVITAFISPFRAERRMARELMTAGEFIEVHVSTPLAMPEARDPKGLYAEARRGELKNFTGIRFALRSARGAGVDGGYVRHDGRGCGRAADAVFF
jgi:adenylylsulfate kinase-like enzyme